MRAFTRTLLSVLVIMGGAQMARAADTIIIVGVVGSSDAYAGDVILRQAYRRLGIDLKIRKLPAERALRLADSGQVDGEVQRIDAIRHVYKNLVQIRPAINFLEAAVFTGSKNFPVEGWESLRPYRIGIIRGIKFAEANTTGMRRYIASGYDALFRMLNNGSLDVGVVPRINGLWHQIISGSDRIHELRPPVTRFKLYHYLHKKNRNLVPMISKVLAEMDVSGELLTIRNHVNAVLIDLARKGLPVCEKDFRCFETGLPAN